MYILHVEYILFDFTRNVIFNYLRNFHSWYETLDLFFLNMCVIYEI